MNFIYSDSKNKDFIQLCCLLDNYLDEIAGGKENRNQYIKYNTLDNINDIVIAYDNNIAAGCAGFKLYDNDTAEIKRVFVKPEYRKKGISKTLVELLEQRAKEKGFKKLILETGEPLIEAMQLYKKAGYKIIKNYGQYKDMKDSICMEKYIN